MVQNKNTVFAVFFLAMNYPCNIGFVAKGNKQQFLLVWPTCWTASCSTLIVCVCVSGQYHQYCSAHDEWLIMKLCIHVRYHTANNVSNFGGDPVTQLHFITIFNVMSPYCSARDEWLIMKLCIYVRYHTANNVSNFGGDPVTQLHFITIFNVFYLRHVKRFGICLPRHGRSRSIINIH